MSSFIVFQSDFGLSDGAVSAMEGVAYNVDENLKIAHLTHDIKQYNIFDASYRLFQTWYYWPSGTIFVSVVDPGVGTKRKSVVARTKDNKYFVTPNNGTLTHVKENIVELREISEAVNRLKDSESSYTFHGRDVYAYTAAKLASGKITYEEVGPLLELSEIIELETFSTVSDENSCTGVVDILDIRFGSLWTSIDKNDFDKMNVEYGEELDVIINHGSTPAFRGRIVYGRSFADVLVGMPIIYINSMNRVAVAINQNSFAKAYSIETGINWKITFSKIK